MMLQLMDIAIVVAANAFAGGAVYGSIRTDLKHIHKALRELKDTDDKTHKRIDDMLMQDRRRAGYFPIKEERRHVDIGRN